MALALDENEPSDDAVILPGANASAPFAPPPLRSRARPRKKPASTSAPTSTVVAPDPASVASRPVEPRFTETATFGLGCFWNAEAAFAAHVGPHGVTRVGYFGGVDVRPDGRPMTLRDVRTGRHGHVEAVRVHFDPTAVPFKFLVERFQTAHDPTVKKANPKYRSVVFAHDDVQEVLAAASVADARATLGDGVTTEVVRIPKNGDADGDGDGDGDGPGMKFWMAEEKDQMYVAKNGDGCGDGDGDGDGDGAGACAAKPSARLPSEDSAIVAAATTNAEGESSERVEGEDESSREEGLLVGALRGLGRALRALGRALTPWRRPRC